MLSMSAWEHERLIEPVSELACTITDRLGFALRRPLAALPVSRSPAARIVAATFRQRHRRLLARHGLAEPR